MAEHSFVQKIPEIRYFKGISQYKKPKEVAHFSYDAKRNLVLNSRKGLGLYDPKKLPIDLNGGYPENYVVRSTEPEGITALLKSIKDLDAHPFLCTWRGIMTKIICAPYSNDEWELYATLSGNTIYLVENEENKDHSFGKSEKDKLMCYYGYNFENIVTKTNTDYATPRHWESADEDTVNTNIQYCSVFSSQLGPFPILLGGEVDCLYKLPVDNSNDAYQSEYTELKTHKVMTSPYHVNSFQRHKLLKTWAQSYLAGVPRIIFGFRNDKGLIQETREYKTEEIPRIVRKNDLWDRHVCLRFGEYFLNILKERIVIDDPKCVYDIRFSNRTVFISPPRFDGDLLEI